MIGLLVFMWAVSASAVAWVSLSRVRAQAHAVARAAHEVRGGLCVARLALDARAADAVEVQLARAGRALEALEGAAPAPEPLDLRVVLRGVVAGWPQVRLVTPARALTVSGDRAGLVQALTNLVANAVEHAAPPITVCGLVRHGAVRIEVSDAGPGLPAPVLDLAARGPRGRRGHGLAVAAAVAAEHGGHLGSAPGDGGATVVLELPALEGQRPA